jgi:hypothetical protein
LYWKTNQKDKGSQAPREEKTFIQDLKATVLDKEVVTHNVAIHEESAEEVKGGSDNWTQSRSLENLGNSTTKAIRESKRLKKTQ